MTKQSPHTLTTLLEIVNTLNAVNFASMWGSLQTIKSAADAAADKQSGSVFDISKTCELQKFSKDLRTICETIFLDRAFLQMVNFEVWIQEGHPYLNKEVNSRLLAIDEALRIDLRAMALVQVPKSKRHFLDEGFNLFGIEVYEAFTEAQPDMKAAGHCLALDLNTAAVFHLMRVVEYGMRAIAKEMRATFGNKTVESVDWYKLIEGIRKKIMERELRPKNGNRRKKGEKERLNYYHSVVDEMNVFRDNWRNNTMHTRSFYNESEAHGVFIRVRDFMQKLAKNKKNSK